MTNENGSKASSGPETRSVIDLPPAPSTQNPSPPSFDLSQVFWFIGQFQDEFAPWGIAHRIRDKQLRNFVIQEPIFASALGIICSRNSGFAWTLDGPSRTVSRMQDILENADMGAGWQNLIVKTSIDLYTQDNGAFWEIVREKDRPDSPFVAMNHLDSARCWHTGDPRAPVIYMDRRSRYHLLKWYNVIEFSEMPTAIEGFYGLQYSSLSRLLRKMQIQKNLDTFDYEKTSGRNTKAIHLVKGVTTQQVKDAIISAQAEADNSGLIRYMSPVVVGTLDPTADVGHDTIDMVAKPTDWKTDEWFKQYINLIAMAFESDYQEFAPLPGGGLGTGAQSEMLHLKSRGKGPGTFMKLITHANNFRILPKNVKFTFNEPDLEAEKGDAEVRAIRAQTRAVRIASGEITPQVARQIANDEGDLPEEFITLMSEQDVTPDVTIDSNSSADSQLAPDVKPGTPAPNASPSDNASTSLSPTARRAPVIRPPTPLGPKLPPGRKDAGKLLAFLLDESNNVGGQRTG